MVTDSEKQQFAARLNEVLDDAAFPPKGSGRQMQLGKDMHVTQKAARKWLEGESFPEIERIIMLAKKYNVSFEWLMTGRGVKSLTEQSPEWPFTENIDRFLSLPESEKSRIDRFIKDTVMAWEDSIRKDSLKAG